MLCDPGAHYLMSLCLSLIIYKKGHKMESAKELCEVIHYQVARNTRYFPSNHREKYRRLCSSYCYR